MATNRKIPLELMKRQQQQPTTHIRALSITQQQNQLLQVNSNLSSRTKPSPQQTSKAPPALRRPVDAAGPRKPVHPPGPNPAELPSMILDNRVIEECLRAHNHYRALHGVPELAHDSELSRSAQVCVLMVLMEFTTNTVHRILFNNISVLGILN